MVRNPSTLVGPPLTMRTTALTFGLFLSCLALSGFAQETSTEPLQGLRSAAPQVWALCGASVTTAPGQRIENATIVIDGAKILDVGVAISIPPEARRIDLVGQHIYAGLIDCYTERNVSENAEAARYWNEIIRPARSVANDYEPDSSLNETQRAQGVTTMLVAPSGGVLKGFASLVLTGDGPAASSILRPRASQHARLTASRNSERTYPNSPMGAVALARQTMLDAQWHSRAQHLVRSDPSLPVPDRNIDLDALQSVLSQTVPLIVDTSNEAFFLRADRFAREFGLKLIVNGSGNEYRRLDAIAATGRPVIVPLNFPKAPNVGTVEAAREVSTEALLHWDHAPENPARIAKSGMRFVFYSHGLDGGDTFLKQIRVAVQRGLPADQALGALTTGAAELFGVQRSIGQIRPGYYANLVVTDTPLFAKDAKVVETWVAGQRYSHSKPLRYDPEGIWRLKTKNPPPGFPGSLDIQLSGGEKLAGEIESVKDGNPSEPVKLLGAVLNGARLSMSFSAEPFGGEGIARATIVLTQQGNGSGSLRWPTSSSSSVTIKKVNASDSSESRQKDADNQSDSSKESNRFQPASSFPVNYPLGAFGLRETSEQPRVLAVRGATIWTCSEAGTIKNATVVAKNGRIVAVGKKVRIPKSAVVIDGAGMHLTPGIIDCHSHFATDGGVNESGQAITAEVRIGDFIDADDINIYRQLAGGVTTSNVLHGSANPIGGQNQVVKLRWGSLGEQLKMRRAPPGIKFALRENVKQSNWGDEFRSRYPQTRMGVEQIFRDAFHRALRYRDRLNQQKHASSSLPVRRDLELEALLEIVEGRRWVHCHSYRQDEILALIRVLDEFGIQIGSFQHILEGYKVADEMVRHGATGSAFSDWWAYKFEVLDAIPYAGALMHKAGVVVSFNSDDRELARHLNHEAAKAMKYGGVSAEEALKFVTLNPAKQLRIDQYVGSIETGKDADFALWSGPPMSTMSRCVQTWIQGRCYFSLETDERLRRENREIRQTLVQKILQSGAVMRTDGKDDDDPAKLWPREDLFCHHDDHDHGHTHQEAAEEHDHE